MFNKGDNVTYINGNVLTHKTIEQAHEAIVTMTSKAVGDLGPFVMTFNKETGKGVEDYLGTRIVRGHRKMPTWIQLGAWIEKHCENVFSYSDVKSAMYWFIATQQATILDGMNGREAAELFLEGIKPIDDNDDGVNDWLEIFYESFEFDDDEQNIDEAEADLLYALNNHFDLNVTEL
ncbi:MAG: hypothetical protein DRJ15_17795 [Bacteroidetes bacterium]|nr:MAG: hypothetical protein DRJ15_17795 [Bacteroidota bacterium]